jgi:hypothetical protein
MRINANIDVQLNDEQTDEIVVQALKKDYVRIYDDFQVLAFLASKLELKDFEKEDMAQFDVCLSAIETLLKYYMYIGDAEEFISSTKTVYNKE